MFVDRAKIHVAAGRGGDGCVSFRREKYVPLGGPDGGDGGDGGSLILIATEGVNCLASLVHSKHWKADSGRPGGSKNCHGRSVEDLIFLVPPGTIVKDAERGFVLKDLASPDDQVVVARGGKGGKGNTRYKSSTNRSPRQRTRGEEGEDRWIELELKVIADVGLVGKPNAGKSTLLGRLSRARPEIADYPFTTKHPNLGIVQVDLDRRFVMADIPGLIEGAHKGAGLGHEFLRHIERSGILVHLVEPQPVDGTDPVDNYLAIRNELEQYDAELGQRPEIIVVTKAELPAFEETPEANAIPDAQAIQEKLAAKLGQEVLIISAVTGQGLNKLVGQIVRTLDNPDGE